MSVTVHIKSCGGEVSGKFADIHGDTVDLFLDSTEDGEGGFRGRGDKLSFSKRDVEVTADHPEVELRHRDLPPPPRLLGAGSRALSVLREGPLSWL